MCLFCFVNCEELIVDKVNYSVLMSVYAKEKPEYLRQSMNSMFDQTVPTNDFVLICDGPISNELEEVITEFKNVHEDILNVVKLEKNMGLGNALRIGIEKCKNNLIARMDSDDISKKDRCEKQIDVFMKNQSLSIIGTNIEEFSINPDIVDSMRVVPKTNDEIIKFSKKRNPFNHPSVMYKKQDVIDSGNYRDVRYMQDYFLWVDMLSNGKKGYNIQEPLVSMRASNDLFKRRSGKEYFKIQKELFKLMLKKGYISKMQYYSSITLRTISAFAPNWLRKSLFKKILRKKSE